MFANNALVLIGAVFALVMLIGVMKLGKEGCGLLAVIVIGFLILVTISMIR